MGLEGDGLPLSYREAIQWVEDWINNYLREISDSEVLILCLQRVSPAFFEIICDLLQLNLDFFENIQMFLSLIVDF